MRCWSLWYEPTLTSLLQFVLFSFSLANDILKDSEPGSFIIRDSQSFPGAFGLAVKVAVPPAHVLQGLQGDLSKLEHPSPPKVAKERFNQYFAKYLPQFPFDLFENFTKSLPFFSLSDTIRWTIYSSWSFFLILRVLYYAPVCTFIVYPQVAPKKSTDVRPLYCVPLWDLYCLFL